MQSWSCCGDHMPVCCGSGTLHHQTPSCVIRSLGLPLGSDSHAAVYTAHPLLQPFTDYPASLSGCNPGPQMENKFCCFMSLIAFSISAPTHLISNHTGFVGVLSHFYLSVHTACSPCPRAREQCVRAQKESERWALPFPPAPLQGGACAICLPVVSSSGCT